MVQSCHTFTYRWQVCQYLWSGTTQYSSLKNTAYERVSELLWCCFSVQCHLLCTVQLCLDTAHGAPVHNPTFVIKWSEANWKVWHPIFYGIPQLSTESILCVNKVKPTFTVIHRQGTQHASPHYVIHSKTSLHDEYTCHAQYYVHQTQSPNVK